MYPYLCHIFLNNSKFKYIKDSYMSRRKKLFYKVDSNDANKIEKKKGRERFEIS